MKNPSTTPADCKECKDVLLDVCVTMGNRLSNKYDVVAAAAAAADIDDDNDNDAAAAVADDDNDDDDDDDDEEEEKEKEALVALRFMTAIANDIARKTVDLHDLENMCGILAGVIFDDSKKDEFFVKCRIAFDSNDDETLQIFIDKYFVESEQLNLKDVSSDDAAKAEEVRKSILERIDELSLASIEHRRDLQLQTAAVADLREAITLLSDQLKDATAHHDSVRKFVLIDFVDVI
jgi:hypothetical protein